MKNSTLVQQTQEFFAKFDSLAAKMKDIECSPKEIINAFLDVTCLFMDDSDLLQLLINKLPPAYT